MGKKSKPTGNEECLRVVVRCRPISSKEKQNGLRPCVMVDEDVGRMTICEDIGDREGTGRNFDYDHVFGMTSVQESIYDSCVRSIVDSVLEGYNGTVFAYGQTGAGKTFTMEGESSGHVIGELSGIIPRACEQIFQHIERSTRGTYLVQCSFVQIYNDNVYDLLVEKRKNESLHLRETEDNNVYVEGAKVAAVHSMDDLMQFFTKGMKNRISGSTNMNLHSSRSHCIFSIRVESSMPVDDEIAAEEGADTSGKCTIRLGTLNLVDLAGSERVKNTNAKGKRLKEAQAINFSLSALGLVFAALLNPKSNFIPYRNSKLTRLLQNSLGGNSKTLMIANIGPADKHYNESLSTLRFAERAKKVKNQPKINEDPKDAQLRQFQDQIAQLRAELATMGLDESELQELLKNGGALGEAIGVGDDEEYEEDIVEVVPGKTIVVKKVVEKVVVRGVKEEDLRKAQEQGQEELEKLKNMTEEERKQLAREKQAAEQRAKNLEQKLASSESQYEQTRSKRLMLSKKLAALSNTLLQGQQMVSEAKQRELNILHQQQVLTQKRIEEERMKHALRQNDNERIELEVKYADEAQHMRAVTNSLQKLIEKCQQTTRDIDDLRVEAQQEREDRLAQLRDMKKSADLKLFLIHQFVPKHALEQIERRLEWDPNEREWVMRPFEFNQVLLKRPNSCRMLPPKSAVHEGFRAEKSHAELGHFMPISNDSLLYTMMRDQRAKGADQMQQAHEHPRHANRDIVTCQLDQLERTTQDWNQFLADVAQEKLLHQQHVSQTQQLLRDWTIGRQASSHLARDDPHHRGGKGSSGSHRSRDHRRSKNPNKSRIVVSDF